METQKGYSGLNFDSERDQCGQSGQNSSMASLQGNSLANNVESSPAKL